MNEQECLNKVKEEYQEKIFFLEQGLGAEVHWFFSQAFEALKMGLYLPACTSFLNGIEASLRITLAQIENPRPVEQLDPVKLLSNRLLKSAHALGVPVDALAFPHEKNFIGKLESKKPNLEKVEVVRVRHNLCHGNILEYINKDLGEDQAFFTPECCRELALLLYGVSKEWAKQLGKFRRTL
jgi:hypothetical protein